VKVKHFLKVYNILPDFPREDDLYYELQQHSEIHKNGFSYADVKLSVSFKLKKEKFEELVDILIQNNQVVAKNKKFYFKTEL